MNLPDGYNPGVNVKDGFFLYQNYPQAGFKKDIGGHWVDAPRPPTLADTTFSWGVFSELDDFVADIEAKVRPRLMEGIWIYSKRSYFKRRIQDFIDSYGDSFEGGVKCRSKVAAAMRRLAKTFER